MVVLFVFFGVAEGKETKKVALSMKLYLVLFAEYAILLFCLRDMIYEILPFTVSVKTHELQLQSEPVHGSQYISCQ